MSGDGAVEWAQGSAGGGLDVVYGVAATPSGDGAYAVGTFSSRQVSFNAVTVLTCTEGSILDAFLLKVRNRAGSHRPPPACLSILSAAGEPKRTG